MFKFIPDGYKNLIVYQEACKLRVLVYKITAGFSRDEMRRVSHMRDSARSVKQNIAEGYRRGTVPQFKYFLSVSNGSAAELDEDIDDCFEDGLLNKDIYNKVSDLSKRVKFLLDRLIKSLYKQAK